MKSNTAESSPGVAELKALPSAESQTHPPRVSDEIRDLLGHDVVLLPIPKGEKGPRVKGWQKTTIERMSDASYIEKLNAGGNIGVLLGKASGNLCTIDVDSDADLEAFLLLNPALQTTLRTRRARGGNLWLRIAGEFPKSYKLENFGEWRATGNQTVIHGKALDTSQGETAAIKYKIIRNVAPITMSFDDIAWPDGLALPWAAPTEPDDLTARLIEAVGQPFTYAKGGQPQTNQMFFVKRFALEHQVLHEPDEREFYTYEADTGAWVRQTPDCIKNIFGDDWQRFSKETNQPAVLSLRTNGLLDGLTALLRGEVEKREAFARARRVIHLANGMLHLNNRGAELRPFSPDYFSRNVCPFSWNESAECPRFRNELLGSALEPEDISLLQRWCGSLLLGGNPAQRLMLIIGTAGGGKSTLVEIIEKMTGPRNVCELRTAHLDRPFETSRFVGKTMLTGKDVPGDFLQRPGANLIKALVGHDLLSPERKNSGKDIQLRGNFGVAITCNSRLRVKLDSDVGAWLRRLMIVRYEKPKPVHRISNFADVLLEAEAEGILRWMVDGAIMHLAECDATGDYQLTGRQAGRVDQLMEESDSVRHFVRKCIKSDAGSTLTTAEIVAEYVDYCDEANWTPFTSKQVERALPDLMLELFRSGHGSNILRGEDKRQKGYPKVAFVKRERRE
ncbi:MAG: bifunctional DNA primase/polymerase [Chthoniobacterales bacterium]